MEDRFEAEFSPLEYLRSYYPLEIDQENKGLLDFYHDVYSVPHTAGGRLLEIGGGPTIYQLISASNSVRSIYFTDWAQQNIDEVVRWSSGPGCSPWCSYISYVLELEGLTGPSGADVARRSEIIKDKLSGFSRLNIRSSSNVREFLNKNGSFDIVSSAFCIDSITSSVSEWRELLGRASSLLSSSGTLVLTSLGESKSGYHVGDKRFPSVDLDLSLIRGALLEAGFPEGGIESRTIKAMNKNEESYASLICVRAKR